MLTTQAFFFNAQRWAVAFPFKLNAAAQLQDAHAERFHTTNESCVINCEMLLNFNFFFPNLWRDATHSRGSILILIYHYRLDACDLKNKNAHACQQLAASGEKNACIDGC